MLFRNLIFIWILVLASVGMVHAGQPAVLWLQTAVDGEPGEALVLETDVNIEVSGVLAFSLVRQRFFNNSGQWAEGRYLFPLPDDSAVESLMIRVGDRLIEGEIQERGQARQTYQHARREGRVAGLVEQERGNLFTTSVANIPPGEEVSIQIGFRQRVDYEHGRFSLRFPTTVAPRYVPGHALPTGLGGDDSGSGWSPDTDRVTDASRVTPPIQDPDGPVHNPLRLQVELRPGMDLASLDASYHLINTDYDGSRWLVTLEGGFDDTRKDFELVWRPAGNGRVDSSVFRQTLGDQDHALLMLVPPPTFATVNTPREVILIIDTSGSMRGSAMEQARESLLFALDRLTARDRFNVIEFNHMTRSLFDKPVAASNSNLHRARRFVDQLRAGGGTVMGPALARAMQPDIEQGFLRQVVFITDGIIANETEVLDQIRRDVGQSRLFTVGIGHGVNSQFLRDAARHGRGSATLIGQLDQIHERMSDLTRQLTSPVLHDIELHWSSNIEIHPANLPDLYTGQPLIVSVRGDRLREDVLITAMSDGQPWQQVIPVETFQAAPGVAAHWGRAAIQAELDRRGPGVDGDRRRQRVLDLALDYQLLSPFTSLVAVDRTPVRSRQVALRRHEVPTHLPHGRELDGFFGAGARSMPATDGGSESSLLRGLLALLLVGLLLGHRRLSHDPDQEDQA